MNVQLNETEEFINGKSTGTLGQVLIRYLPNHIEYCICAQQDLADVRSPLRCNNVLWISAAKGVEMNNDVKMED